MTPDCLESIAATLQVLKEEQLPAMHIAITERLDRIESQTTKTNGRVTALESTEKMNKVVRYVFGIVVMGILAAVGNAYLGLINLK